MVASYPHSTWTHAFSVVAVCHSCKDPFLIDTIWAGGKRPDTLNGDAFHEATMINDVWPAYEAPAMIEFLPKDVAKAFIEGEETLANNHLSSAAVAYRKAIERTLKEQHVEAKGVLNTRIRALEKQNALPKVLIDLLDTIRFLGNDGAHDDDPTKADVIAGRDFTRLFLTYTYELPARVEAALAGRK